MSILICGCSSVLMLESLCSGSGKSVVTGWSSPIQAHQIDNLRPGRLELADFELADLPTRALLHLSLGQDA